MLTANEENCENKLDPALFPYVKEAPSANPTPVQRPAATQAQSLRSAKPSWHQKPRPGASQDSNRQRLFVFVAGGMTYSEVREVYQLSSSLNKDIYIGLSFPQHPRQNVVYSTSYRIFTHHHPSALRR